MNKDIYILETDASHNNITNESGLGGVIYKNGQILDCFSAYIIDDSENYEAKSLLYGLELSRKHNITNLIVKTDALNNAKYLNLAQGTTRPPSTDKKLWNQIHSVISEFDSFKITHIPREENRIADFLSTIYKNKKINFTPLDNHQSYLENLKVISSQNKTHQYSCPTIAFSINSNEENLFLNTIKFDFHNEYMGIESIPVENNIEIITNSIFNILKNTVTLSEPHLVFNGLYTSTIRTSLFHYKGLSKTFSKAFIELSSHWQELNNISLLKTNKHILLGHKIVDIYKKENPEEYLLSIQNKKDIEINDDNKVTNAYQVIPFLPNKKKKQYSKYNILKHFTIHAVKDKNNLLIKVLEYNNVTHEKTLKKYNIRDDYSYYIDFLANIFNIEKSRISFHLNGLYSEKIYTIVRNNENITYNSSKLKPLIDILSSHEQILLANNPNALIESFPIEKENMPLNAESIKESIRILGLDTYNIGDREDIENTFKISSVKKEDISEIQKKFFSVFIKIGFSNIQHNKLTDTQKKQFLIDTKQNLINEGIKLRF